MLAAALLALGASAADAHTRGPGERARETVVRLASFGPRVAGSAAERRAGEAVAGRLRALGYRVETQRFRLPSGGTSRNVVAFADGPARALVVAHVDSVTGSPGANDNGSGVAVLLELARALRSRPGLAFAALGAEERAVTGSSIHLGSLRLVRSLSAAERRSIRFAVSLDMVGVGTRLHVRGIERRPNRSGRLLLAGGSRQAGAASYLPDPGWSDHAELTRAGVPAAWVQWREDACWHSPCDRAARVGVRQLARAYYLTYWAIVDALGDA